MQMENITKKPLVITHYTWILLRLAKKSISSYLNFFNS